MAQIYMKNIPDWKEATLMLSFEQKGYFDEIISLIYLYDDRLPDDDNLICKAMPVNKKIHMRLKKAILSHGLIEVRNGFYFNSRSTQELVKINSISTQNRVKAAKRWAKSLKTNKTDDATAETAAMQKVKVNSEVKDIDKSISKTPPKKGCRIDGKFKDGDIIPDDYLAAAAKKGLGRERACAEFEKFINYWTAASGRTATKRNWLSAWRYWVANSAEWSGNNGGYRNGQSRGGGTPLVDIAADLINELCDDIP